MGEEFTAAGWTGQQVRASWRGQAAYYDWNMTLDLDGADSVLGRGVVVYGTTADANRIVACGIIQPGCSPCRDGSCDPPEEESEERNTMA